MAGLLLLVDEFVGQHRNRQRQRHDAAAARPGIDSAEQEIGREKSGDRQQHRRQHEADSAGKAGMPQVGVRRGMIRRGDGHWGTGAAIGCDTEACCSWQSLHTRGRFFKNETEPLARQL